MLRGIEPLLAVQVLLHRGVLHVEGLGIHHDGAGGFLRRVGIDGQGAGNAVGGAVDGLQRRIQLESGVVDTFGILEIERLWRGGGGDDGEGEGRKRGGGMAVFHRK